MKTSDLGLPIEYQRYPQLFDVPANNEYTNCKNQVVENILKKYHTKSIIDMTCGTGAQVIYLAKLGYDVIGSDFSPNLIEQAQVKLEAEGLNIPLIVNDMREGSFSPADAVITIDNAIGHLVKQDFKLALQNVYHNLKQDGIYVFDILNLSAMSDEVISQDNQKVSGVTISADGTEIINQRTTSIDRENGFITSTEDIVLSKDGEHEKIQNTCTLQIYTKEELKSLLEAHQFKVLEQRSIDTYTFQVDSSGYGILTVAQKK